MFGKKNELQVQVEQLPDVFEDNGLALVKIEDDKVINRIISAVPQLAQAGVNVGAVAEGMQLANQGVYQAILPAGAKLVNSKDMEGAVRGFFRNKKGIAGQANWMNADSAVNKIAAANIANAAMGAAALVVGQYYMKQINGELADIFYNNYLKEHPLGQRIKTILFHRSLDAYKDLVGCLESISKDNAFIDKMNGISTVEVPKYQAKTLPEFDVFISHANKDKEDLIEELYKSLNTLGVNIFYDKESLEWGDNWKDRILNGTKKAEFAIIVISENFFDREWTERELAGFLNRQNRNGQKLILPILHNITTEQLKAKYPLVADIQAIDSAKYSCDQIALLFARQLIKRLKNA